jgi:hypothetical protein
MGKPWQFFKRYTELSVLVLVGADLSATLDPSFLIMGIGLAPVAGGIILLTQWQATGKFKSSLVEAIVAAFLVAIPTPLASVVVAAYNLVTRRH